MMLVSWVNVDIYHGTKASFTRKHASFDFFARV